MTWLRKTYHDINGATAIEYTLIAAGISVVVLAAVVLIGDSVNNMFNNVTNGL